MLTDRVRLVDWLVDGARKTDPSPEGLLQLGARAFTAAQVLFDDVGPRAPLASNPPRSPRNASEVRARLRDRKALVRLTPAELYSELVSILSTTDYLCDDATLFPRKRVFGQGFSSPRRLPLDSPIDGVVTAWRRPAAAWRHVFNDRRHDGPRAFLTKLDMTWKCGDDGAPALSPVPLGDGARRFDLGGLDGFSVALCPMVGMAMPPFTAVPGVDGFTVQPRIDSSGALSAQIDDTIRLAIGNKIHCLVFPELSVDLTARQQALDSLSRSGQNNTLQAVVAGSYHVHEGGDPPYPHEAATFPGLANKRAKPLFKQRKPGRLRLPARVIGGAQSTAVALDELHAGATDMHVLDTDAGRFAVLIASEADCPEAPAFVRAARPDFLLILSFSTTPSAFLRLADDLARDGITTLFVQSHGASSLKSPAENGDPVLAFVRLAETDDATDIPLRWCWRFGQGLVTSRAAGDRWTPPAAKLRDLGYLLHLASAPDDPVALVLDLGRVFQRMSHAP